MESSNFSSDSKLTAVHFVFGSLVTDIRQISASFMERYDVQRIVYLKKSPKEKTLLKSAVIVFKTQKNWDDFKAATIKVGGISMQVLHISLEDAEDLIDQKKTKLYVGNIPFPVDNLTLWNHFAQYGALDYSYILKPPTKRGPKGFGFVIFQKRESACSALSVKNYLEGVKLNCKLFMNKTKLKKRGGEVNEKSSTATPMPPAYNGKELTEDEFSEQEQLILDFPIEDNAYHKQEAQQYDIHSHQQKYTPFLDYESPQRSFKSSSLSFTGSRNQARTRLSEQVQDMRIPVSGNLIQPNHYSVPENVGFNGEQAYRLQEQVENLSGEDFPPQAQGKPVTTELSEPHPCGCEEDICKECWCDMIDSQYFSPPCCLCDFKPDPVKCHELLAYVQKSQQEKHCIHSTIAAPHDPWDHNTPGDCLPCSKYQQLKREMQQSSNGCREYRLFSISK